MTKQSARKHHPHRKDEEPAQEGQGGTRHGYRSSNEIEDMEIFDDEPGKDPSEDGLHDAKSIDDNRFRERK
jgi:hypothetical protein